MPSRTEDDHGVPLVAQVLDWLTETLDAVAASRSTAALDSPLHEDDIADALSHLPPALSGPKIAGTKEAPAGQDVAVEAAARSMLSNLIANTDINSPEFARVWNLFDILLILTDRSVGESQLQLWLLEELMDSQTIAGCVKVFDYVESRRQRMLVNSFEAKKLVLLRTCNELLRRLSRAEDTAFAGRVFILMFQSYPLGDRSSVNLRGNYHTSNTTTFDETAPQEHPEEGDAKMDVDTQMPSDADKQASQAKSVTFSSADAKDKALETESFYPVFWSLQHSFNQPKTLFDPSSFTSFKTGLETTLSAFATIESRNKDKKLKSADDARRGTKRKRDAASTMSEADSTATYNPRYLTSRDLFDLEMSDLTFRRYILVQALIIVDFLLTLTPAAKEKSAKVPKLNRSVAYLDAELSEEDITWATATKRRIAEHISDSPDGPFFLRMVETVLSRDKNWVRWKLEDCPPISLPPVAPSAYASAIRSARGNTTNKRMRATPMGALNLDFLRRASETSEKAWSELRRPERYELPPLESFKKKIAGDDLEIEMPDSKEAKIRAEEGKASKTWRALRIAARVGDGKGGSGRRRLRDFDRIESWEDVGVVFEEPPPRTRKKEDKKDEEEGAAVVVEEVKEEGVEEESQRLDDSVDRAASEALVV